MAKDTVVKGVEYRIGTLDAFKQFHISRRLAPALFELANAAAKTADEVKEVVTGNEMEALKPVVDAVSKLSDEDAEYVMKTCLAVVSRKVTDTAYQPVIVSGRMQFQDMGLDVIMPLTMEVVADNLGAFFNALPTP